MVSELPNTDERLIWATRGSTWGFRFIRNGGLPDPLSTYESCFSGLGERPEGWRKVNGKVALRFLDPLGRKDSAGRVIPHDFVISPPLSEVIDSVDVGIIRVWPLVEDQFASIWELDDPS